MSGFDIDLPPDMGDDAQSPKSYVPADQLSLANVTGEAPYLSVFEGPDAGKLVGRFVNSLVAHDPSGQPGDVDGAEALRVGSAAFNAFLQANVTGPVLDGLAYEQAFSEAYEGLPAESRAPETRQGVASIEALRSLCLRSLDTDGVSVYTHIPHIELFCLARWIFTSGAVTPTDPTRDADELAGDLAWIRFRIHLWHYKLLSQPSLGPNSMFTKTGRWTDVATLQERIEQSLQEAEDGALQSDAASRDAKVQFLLEKANAHIMLGHDALARQAVRQATEISGFVYAVSGALGKRTKFQEKSISQLVVLAKSNEEGAGHSDSAAAAPHALPLNDDTLLEKISFTNEDKVEDVTTSTLPEALQDLTPDNQPPLRAEDQIILLTEATIKDTFSLTDSLTAEEIRPFAVRVLDDKSTNWQIYTHALLVRSRIEMSRSRTIERAILQMQAVVDQVIVDTDRSGAAEAKESNTGENDSVPTIKISGADGAEESTAVAKPTTFLPAAASSDSASPQVRLRYIHALSSPPRWHLESELAFGWASVGSLVSALEIFKRLRLWPEVALCLASSAATEDEDGRGSGGEEKARAIVRWQLFNRTDGSKDQDAEDADRIPDTNSLKAKDFYGPERDPPPPNAPRLWCILGDLEDEPKHYERAWAISGNRFGRAQKSLGEFYLQKKEWEKAGEAYRLAVSVNRLSPELWSRLGDVELRLGNFPDATEAFQRAIGVSNDEEGGEGARTWSNLGTALLSWYRQIAKENKGLTANKPKVAGDEDEDEEGAGAANGPAMDPLAMPATARAAELNKPAYKLIQDALTAFKRGATIAASNWRIWDNVVTLAASLSPAPGFDDVILGTRNVLQLRGSEDALDAEVLGLLLREVTKDAPLAVREDGVYEPPRGSLARKVTALFEEVVAPLVTGRSEIWALVSRLRAWRRDWAGAVDAAEKGWRAASAGGAAASGTSLSAATAATGARPTSGAGSGRWQTGEDAEAWDAVVARTAELVAAYENWGPRVEAIGDRWKSKARSAVRTVMGRGKECWEGSEGWTTLEGLMEDLRA